MSYSNLFDEFWNAKGRFLRINNAARIRDNLYSKMSRFEVSSDIDDYVRNLRTGKESTRRIIVEFYRYIEEKKHITVESDLKDKRFYDNPVERQLEIAKFLHERRTASEIEEQFDIDPRTRRSDLQALEDGIEVLGSTISISKEREGRKYYYKSTLHPVFLPLNLTEVYALTVYLERMAVKAGPNNEILRNLADRVKCQLSDYAYERLYPGDHRRKRYQNSYLDDENLAQQRKGIYMYLMKSGNKCHFFWQGQEYIGQIRYDGKEYRIRLEDGSYLEAPLEEVECIIDSLKYR